MSLADFQDQPKVLLMEAFQGSDVCFQGDPNFTTTKEAGEHQQHLFKLKASKPRVHTVQQEQKGEFFNQEGPRAFVDLQIEATSFKFNPGTNKQPVQIRVQAACPATEKPPNKSATCCIILGFQAVLKYGQTESLLQPSSLEVMKELHLKEMVAVFQPEADGKHCSCTLPLQRHPMLQGKRQRKDALDMTATCLLDQQQAALDGKMEQANH